MFVAAALLAWLGASLVVLSDGRQGLALGLALITVGFAVLAWPSGALLGASAVAAGGAIASVQCWRSGPATWGIMPPGSTPRVVLCVGSGVLALWVAASVTTGPSAPLRFAALVVVGLMGVRVLASRETAVLLAAIAGLALALAVAPGVAAPSAGPVPDIAGGLVAAGVVVLRPAARVRADKLGA